jgi:hypothetical protein
VQVPVYVDLMQLPYDATPADFFQLVSRLASAACMRMNFRLKGFLDRRQRMDPLAADEFRSQMLLMREASGTDLKFYFVAG